MLGRIADRKYIEKTEDAVAVPFSLAEKLEILLDVICRKMLHCRRNEAPTPEDDLSASNDSDY